MKIIMNNNMNANSKQDPSNLNSNLNHGGNGGGSLGLGGADAAAAGKEPASNGYHFQGGSSSINNANNSNNNMASSSNNNANEFLQMQNAGSDTDTCASSQYNMRRVSKDSLVSRDSLSDMLSADQVASNNVALMNMLANQHQQQMGGGGNGNNQNMNFANFSNGANNNNNGQQQPHQALNQSMSQLLMNGSMNMNSMSQLNSAASMMNNMGHQWNNNNSNNSNNSNSLAVAASDPTAYGMDTNGNNGGNGNGGVAPLLIPPKKTKNKHKQTFAQKLMHLLSVKDCHSAIRWMPNGCAFCIVDSKALVDRVLPKYFKEAKYTSFTRKLNRWGFKHFTLPTSEPSTDKEMSIYTHEKFLRDNPALSQQMDGGHRRRNSSRDDDQQGLGASMTSQASGMGGLQGDVAQQLQQQSMMMQQMQHQQQQQQQQNMMMQQMQQMGQLQQQAQMGGQNQGNQGNPMIDVTALQGQGGGLGLDFNAMMGSAFNNNNGSMNSLMDHSGGAPSAAMGMRRTSLGFMPYLPTSNRRDSGFSLGGLSTVSNDLGGSYPGGAAAAGMGGIAGSTQSLQKFHKMSPIPGVVGNNESANATFDDYKQGMVNAQQQVGSQQGEGKSAEGGDNQEDIRHSQAKLAVLEDMIAKERMKQLQQQSLLSSLDPDQVHM